MTISVSGGRSQLFWMFSHMAGQISVVIRTYNEAGFIGRLIEKLRVQEQYGEDLEIVVVDSGSTDFTTDILKKHDVKLISITQKEFNYSKALNLGIEGSECELVVILSAHSIPCSNDWLMKMAQHFQDEDVAGVYCRQKPWPDAGAGEVLRIEKTFGACSRIFSKDIPGGAMRFSNAASCVRRSVWRKHPFVMLPAAEDREWSEWAIANGYKIIYDSEAEVYHSHSESCRKATQRVIEMEKTADIRNNRKRNLLLTTKQSIGWCLRDIKKTLSSECSRGRRIKSATECIARSFWYVLDFNRKIAP